MQDFLGPLTAVKLSGRLAFAFVSRRDSPLAGSAAKCIESKLRNQGLKLIHPSTSAIIASSAHARKKEEFVDKDEWKELRHQNEELRGGEDEKFMQLGARIGRALVSSIETSRPRNSDSRLCCAAVCILTSPA